VASSLKLIFAGTPDFAAYALQALLQSPHHIQAVYTQPDRPAGRGLHLCCSPVKTLALLHQLPVEQPAALGPIELERIQNMQADAMIVAAYGLLLPSALLSIPRLGCINIHPSLLPRWRGAAPIPRSIAAGDSITGVSIMQMDQGLDTGPVLLQHTYIPKLEETAGSLHDTLAALGAAALLETLDLLALNAIVPRAQDHHLATYAHKLSKEEATLDFTREAAELERDIRAFNPWPIAHLTWQGQNLRIFSAQALNEQVQCEPRTLIRASKQGIDIATGKGVLRLLELQMAGGKKLSAAEFYHARREKLLIGTHFI
jgi:methionyl-tRNA formyltransferase